MCICEVQLMRLLTHLLTYLLTPWCRALLEKLTGLQLVKKFPVFHGTRRFITALISVRHLSLSWASPIQSIYPYPASWRSILILSTNLCLGLPSGLFPSDFPTKTLYTPSPHPYAPHAQPVSFFSILSPAQYWASSSLCSFLHSPVTSSLLGPNIHLTRLRSQSTSSSLITIIQKQNTKLLAFIGPCIVILFL